MNGPATWPTDDPCPVCGTKLPATKDGSGEFRQDCSLCGWAATWAEVVDDDARTWWEASL